MGNVNIVTGHTGTNHVTANDHASYHAGTVAVSAVLKRGSNFGVSTTNPNTVRIGDGDLLLKGHHIRINAGEHIDLTISNSSSGKKRIDLIVARYSKDSETGVEEADIAVITGTESSATPVVPQWADNDILDGNATTTELPLYKVDVASNGIQGVYKEFTSVANLLEHEQDSNNPHRLTPASIGAAAEAHTHTFCVTGSYTGDGTATTMYLDTIPNQIAKQVTIIDYVTGDIAFLIPSATSGNGVGIVVIGNTHYKLSSNYNPEINKVAWWGTSTAERRMNIADRVYHYTIQY